jgi:nucleoside-diphosphate-sugar epimerase
MRVFVAGAGGFIGAGICGMLSAAGAVVLGHVRSRDGDLSPDSLPGGVDAVVNAAGRLGRPGAGPDEMEASNVRPAEVLGRFCASQSVPLVHISTPGVCGLRPGASEDCPPAPPGPYEESKARAERMLSGSMPAALLTVLRPDFVYGPGDGHKLALFRQAERGWFPLVGSGGARIRPTFVDDCARAVMEALPGGILGPGTWNIAGPEVLPFREVVACAARSLGRRTLLIPVPRLLLRAALALGPLAPVSLSRGRLELFGTDHWVDTSKAENAGFVPRWRLAAGMEATVRWIRERK